MYARVSLLLVLAACNGSSGPPATFDAAAADEVALLPSLPMNLILFSAFAIGFSEESGCPSIVDDGEDLTATGGCDDGSGTEFTGTVTVEGYETDDTRYLYDGWGNIEGDDTMRIDGEQRLVLQGDEYVLTSDGLEVTGTDGATTMSVTLHEHQMVMAAPGGEIDLFRLSYTAEGSIELADRGSFTLTADSHHGDSCDAEPTSGSAVFTGANTLTFTSDGASACDGCTPWETSDGLSGEVCIGG